MDPGSCPCLLRWWRDPPGDPGRKSIEDADVQRLLARVAPGSSVTDLGGIMSLNVRLDAAGLVLRVHQVFATRARLMALQAVRHALAERGLLVAEPVRWQGAPVFRCGPRLSELERHVAHERLPATYDTYEWLFGAMGELDAALATVNVSVPRPAVATYAPPASLRRWLAVTEPAVRGDVEATEIVRLLADLVRCLERRWVPGSSLPTQLVHGDGSPRNVCRAPDGGTVYFDFGFVAVRPRVHELAYALAFMTRALGGDEAADGFDWPIVPRLVEAYEAGAGWRLTAEERRALAPYAAAVPLYAAALDGFSDDPAANLRLRLPFVRVSERLLAHPDLLPG